MVLYLNLLFFIVEYPTETTTSKKRRLKNFIYSAKEFHGISRCIQCVNGRENYTCMYKDL